MTLNKINKKIANLNPYNDFDKVELRRLFKIRRELERVNKLAIEIMTSDVPEMLRQESGEL